MKMTLGKTIAVVLVMLLSFGCVMWIFGGLNNLSLDTAKDRFDKEINADNLYTAECMTLTDRNDGNGLIVTVNDNGSIHIKGTADEDTTYAIGTVSLEAGEYTFTALDGASLKSAYVYLDLNGTPIKADFTGNTFTVVEDSTVQLSITVKKGTEINATVYPVIVSGTEAASFFN